MRTLLFATALSVLGLACSSSASGGGPESNNPLVGTWTSNTFNVGFTVIETLTFRSDGTMDDSITGSNSCSGTIDYKGATWSSTATTITFGGSPTCSGSVNCGLGGSDCTSGNNGPMGTCKYTVGGRVLTLTCSDDAGAKNPVSFNGS